MVSFPLEGGGEVLVHVQSAPRYGEVVTRGRQEQAADAVEKAGRYFDSALGAIRVMAEGVLGQLNELAAPPSEVRVQFGLEFNAKAGAVIASTGAAAQLNVDLTWHPSTRCADDFDDRRPGSARRPFVRRGAGPMAKE
ncbi:CU044_2847 family protein [Nocardia nepalensis]|uniref:CU044_2847 family protein n=1 Tax=Nocardia nepalensis TaxID=3375448 RepID=UPI003B683C6B